MVVLNIFWADLTPLSLQLIGGEIIGNAVVAVSRASRPSG
jgi:hypothetical protein